MTHFQTTTIQAMVPRMEDQGSRKLLTICLGAYSFHSWLAFVGASYRYGLTSGGGARAQPRDLPSAPLLWHQPALGTTAMWCYWWLLPLEDLKSAFWVLVWPFNPKSASSASRQLCQSHFSSKQGNNKPAWSSSPVRHRAQLEAAKPSSCWTRGSKRSNMIVKIFVKVLRFLKFITKLIIVFSYLPFSLGTRIWIVVSFNSFFFFKKNLLSFKISNQECKMKNEKPQLPEKDNEGSYT